jgi:transcriptional antiterminator RfaH
MESGEQVGWYCLRSQPKHEHIAAAHLRQFGDVEVFNPRIRFTRSTRQGPALVTEALFPNYLFARFDLKRSLGLVRSARGVRAVVHFGGRWPTISESVIDDLRRLAGDKELCLVEEGFVPGDQVQVSGGVFHGLVAVVTSVISGRERVRILLDFLGRSTEAEVAQAALVKLDTHPLKAAV